MSEFRYYYGDTDELEGMTREEVREVTLETYEDAERAYEELLDEIYPDVKIGELSWTAGYVVREMDPTAFRVGVSDSYVEIDVEDYPEDDEA